VPLSAVTVAVRVYASRKSPRSGETVSVIDAAGSCAVVRDVPDVAVGALLVAVAVLVSDIGFSVVVPVVESEVAAGALLATVVASACAEVASSVVVVVVSSAVVVAASMSFLAVLVTSTVPAGPESADPIAGVAAVRAISPTAPNRATVIVAALVQR
jgi:hypothetical protein